MPRVVPIPIGQNANLVKGIDDRIRALEARRNSLGIFATTDSYQTSSTTLSNPTTWHPVTALISPVGNAWLSYGCQQNGGWVELAVIMDGSTIVASFTDTTANSYEFTMEGISGITPGFHTFQFQVAMVSGSPANPITVEACFLTVWPF